MLGSEKDALDVDGHDPVEHALVHLFHGAGPLRHARVGVEDVEPAPCRHRLADRLAIVLAAADVGGEGESLAPGLLDLLRRPAGGVGVEVDHPHTCAFAGEEERRGLADARARARDDGDSVLELHRFSP